MSGHRNGLWHDSGNLATPHVPPRSTPIRGLVGTLSPHDSFHEPGLVVGMPCSRQGKEGTARLQVCLSVLLPSAWCYHLGLFSVPWEAGWGEAGIGQWSMEASVGWKEHITRRSITQPIPLQGTQLSSGKGFCVSPTHVASPAAAARKVGWGRAHFMVLGLSLGLLQPPSRFHSTFRSVFTGVCRHLRHITILSALHFFIVPITIWSWYLYMYLFTVFLSKPPLDLQLHKGCNFACSQLSSQHWAQCMVEMLDKSKLLTESLSWCWSTTWFQRGDSCSISCAFPTKVPGSPGQKWCREARAHIN